jgi:hypothetical protein
MSKVRFDCNGHNAPAYGCSEPGDNSGDYYHAADVERLEEERDVLRKRIGVLKDVLSRVLAYYEGCLAGIISDNYQDVLDQAHKAMEE